MLAALRRQDRRARAISRRALRREHPEAVLISASKGWHLDSLLRTIEAELARSAVAQPAPGARTCSAANTPLLGFTKSIAYSV